MSAFLRGDGVVLRPVEEDDLEWLQRMRNHPEIRRRTGDYQPENREAIETVFEEELSDEESVHLLVCPADAVEENADDGEEATYPDPVGYAGFRWADEDSGVAHVQYWLAPAERDHDVAVAALACLARYAFDELRYHRVGVRALATDEARQSHIEAAGFSQEIRVPDERLVDGAYVDVLRYGMLEDEL
jgi:RimJ/RimL family protein N-acetyltransferase